MFGIGFPELLLILAIALMVIGPRRLPDVAKALGRALGEFKRATDEFKQTINEETRAAEIREQIMKGGKIYPPEANRTQPAEPPPAPATGDSDLGVNPKPAGLGPRAQKGEAGADAPAANAASPDSPAPEADETAAPAAPDDKA